MACGSEAVSEEYLQFMIDYELTPETIGTSGVNFCSVDVDEGMSIVYIREEELLKNTNFLRGYSYFPKCYGLMVDDRTGLSGFGMIGDGSSVNLQPLEDSGILRIQKGPLSLTGQGVVMGFLDTGIRYTLPEFRNTDGSTRILAIWDQTLSAQQLNEAAKESGGNGGDIIYKAPDGFGYGVEFTREQINRALMSKDPYSLVPTNDENGHGTKMCSVAAGSYLEETGFRGAAYDCDIVVVKLKSSPKFLTDYYLIPPGVECYSDPDILLALKYIRSFQVVFQRPLVLCLGLGTSNGNHSGESLLSQYLDRTAMARSTALVIAGGNEGNSSGHFRGEIAMDTSQNWVDCELLVGEKEQGFLVELWGKVPGIFSVEITSPAGELIPRIPYRAGQSVNYRFVYSNTNLSVDYVTVEQASGDELILMRFETPLPGIWKIRVYGEGGAGVAVFDMWLPITQFRERDTMFLRPDPDTTLTEPSYCRGGIGVSTYQSSNNSFYLNSGRGFAADGFIQPDLAAPGVGISTALGTDSGSSLAAAMTAGASAQFMQWAVVEKNYLLANTESLRNYLVRGADRDRSLSYPNKAWGYGRLNLAGTFDKIAGVTYI